MVIVQSTCPLLWDSATPKMCVSFFRSVFFDQKFVANTWTLQAEKLLVIGELSRLGLRG